LCLRCDGEKQRETKYKLAKMLHNSFLNVIHIFHLKILAHRLYVSKSIHVIRLSAKNRFAFCAGLMNLNILS
jgi:hypothetical protein